MNSPQNVLLEKNNELQKLWWHCFKKKRLMEDKSIVLEVKWYIIVAEQQPEQNRNLMCSHYGLPYGSVGEKSACNAADTENPGLIPGSRRSPGLGNGNPLQYSCLKNIMDRGTQRVTVQRVEKSQTGLSMQAGGRCND